MNPFRKLSSYQWLTMLTGCASVLYICGCEKDAVTVGSAPPSAAPPVQSLSSNEVVQTGAKGDPATYASNRPMNIDINGDGTVDSVIMNNNILTWQRSCQGPDIALLTIGFPLHAYTFRVPPGRQRIALYVFDLKDDEYYAENLGNSSDGTPTFGALEATK